MGELFLHLNKQNTYNNLIIIFQLIRTFNYEIPNMIILILIDFAYISAALER
jgi:hypothetical protein